jgi:hypothetical protein
MYSKTDCEYLRQQLKNGFSSYRNEWIDVGRWVLPHRIKMMLSEDEAKRNNQHIVDSTHIIALRSYVAGFLEGNTSTSRPWYRQGHPDPDVNRYPDNKEWLDRLTMRSLSIANASNLYHILGQGYYDYGTFNNACIYVDELPGRLHFHVLTPGTYYVQNDAFGVANILVREFSLTVKALVDRYGKKVNGKWDWSNFSDRVKRLYENQMYSYKIDLVQVVKPNEHFNPQEHQVLANREYISLTYELGSDHTGSNYALGIEAGMGTKDHGKFLSIKGHSRKPFIAFRSESAGNNAAWGVKGPSTDALGLIKSLNKKAIGKDIALDKMLNPAVQGPANLSKSYRTTNPNSYIPIDPSMGNMKVQEIYQINPAVATLNQDVSDLRNQVDKLYFADYLLYLTRNPKTRTKYETEQIVNEQQLIIGPNLQSLNWTLNHPLVDFLTSWTIENDPYLGPPPEGLQGQFLRTEFISVFAQAQRAADLPALERYKAMIMEVGQVRPEIFDKINLDKFADLYEDRLYLPAGLNEAQARVDAKRQQAMAMAQRQQAMQETLPAMAGAMKDLGSLKQK